MNTLTPVTAGACSACGAPVSGRHGDGPWLITGHGIELAHVDGALGKSLAEQCAAHGVDAEVHALPAADRLCSDLGFYLGLVVMLPRQLPGDTPRLVNSLVRSYRARRTVPIASHLAGDASWYQVGTVQLVGHPEDLQSHVIKAARREADMEHSAPDVDLFAIFKATPGAALREAEMDALGIADTAARSTMRRVAEWHVDVAEVPGLLSYINEDVRLMFESRRYPALRRPLRTRETNQFDLLLDCTDTELNKEVLAEVGDWNKWMTANNRAVGYAIAEIRKAYPEFARPSAREGQKELVREFRELYKNLRLLAPRLVRTTRPTGAAAS